MALTKYVVTLFVLGLCCKISFQQQDKEYIPSVVWDDNNPLFQCKDPIIRMRQSDLINVHCQHEVIHNYIRSKRFQIPLDRTRLLYVPNEEQYKQCNATGATSLLKCEDGQKERTCVNGEDCTQYFIMLTEEDQKVFTLRSGKMHHFIGTTIDDGPNQMEPCYGNGTKYKHAMKFRIYVCTDEEERRGECEPCKSEACYYSQCKEKCEAWKDSNENIFQDAQGTCFKHQTQNCVGQFTSAVQNNTRQIQIQCPAKVCERWRETGLITYKNNVCTKPQDRQCTDFRGVKSEEMQSPTIDCPEHTCTEWKEVEKVIEPTKSGDKCSIKQKQFCTFKNTQQTILDNRVIDVNCTSTVFPTVLANKGEKISDDDKDLYIYIAIAASIGSLVIGIFIGFVLTKVCQGSAKKEEIVQIVEKIVPIEGLGPIMSYDNKNFHLDPVMEDTNQAFSLADVEFVPATHTVGTTKRQVMVARSVSFYNPDVQTGHYYHQRRNTGDGMKPSKYRPPSTITESNRNVMRHPSATSKTVLIRNHSDVTERPRSDSDTSVFNLKQPDDCVSEEV